MRRTNRCLTIIQIAIAALLLAPIASAKTAVEADDGVEIDLDARALQDELRPRPVDTDVADTVLIFTNFGKDARVRCVGFDRNGEPVGRAWAKVPSLGLRIILASHLSDGRDFVGHAQCGVPKGVKGTAIFLGPALTDLPAINPKKAGRIQFPVVTTY